jgi:hypothetical protein
MKCFKLFFTTVVFACIWSMSANADDSLPRAINLDIKDFTYSVVDGDYNNKVLDLTLTVNSHQGCYLDTSKMRVIVDSGNFMSKITVIQESEPNGICGRLHSDVTVKAKVNLPYASNMVAQQHTLKLASFRWNPQGEDVPVYHLLTTYFTNQGEPTNHIVNKLSE